MLFFFFLMGPCKTLNCPAQKAKSQGGILVVRALYRTPLTVETCSQYNQKKKERKKERKKENKTKQRKKKNNNRLLMITF